MARVILPDCCEDWILAYGAFYQEGAEFGCLECSGTWRKLGPGRFQSLGSGRIWAERVRGAEGREFRYLAAEDGEKPMTERCCAKLILDHHRRIRPGKQFACPLCGSEWKKELMQHRSGLQVAGYTNLSRGVTIAVQPGEGRSFLVPLDEYQPPRYE